MAAQQFSRLSAGLRAGGVPGCSSWVAHVSTGQVWPPRMSTHTCVLGGGSNGSPIFRFSVQDLVCLLGCVCTCAQRSPHVTTLTAASVV